ncbi:PTS sugar transporter subunit IIC, partial [Mycobacterium kansasii]
MYSKGTWSLVGMGDLINTILVIAIAIVVIFLIRNYVGSFSIIWEPIICGSLIGAFGMWSYTYVHLISMTVGNILNSFTTLQPV